MDHARLQLGAQRRADGSCEFLVWAPRAAQVDLKLVASGAIDDPRATFPLAACGDGYWTCRVPDVAAGTRVRVPARRRPRAARPRLAFSARWSPPAQRRGRRWFRLARFRLARLRAGRSDRVRIARRCVFARRYVRGDHRPARLADGTGRDRDRADARRPVSRPPQLGLRRRAPVCRAEQLRRTGRAEAAGRCLPRAGWAWCSTWSTTTWAPKGTIWPNLAPISAAGIKRPGDRPSTSRSRGATRSAASSSTTP